MQTPVCSSVFTSAPAPALVPKTAPAPVSAPIPVLAPTAALVPVSNQVTEYSHVAGILMKTGGHLQGLCWRSLLNPNHLKSSRSGSRWRRKRGISRGSPGRITRTGIQSHSESSLPWWCRLPRENEARALRRLLGSWVLRVPHPQVEVRKMIPCLPPPIPSRDIRCMEKWVVESARGRRGSATSRFSDA